MEPLQMTGYGVLFAVLSGLVPLAVLAFFVYKLSQIAEHTRRTAEAVEYLAMARMVERGEAETDSVEEFRPD